MLISQGWIKDFVDLPEIAPDDLANDLTMATAEVEDVKTTGEYLKKVQIAQIKSFKKHPEADKLNLVTFDIGKETREVVCGAPNVREGLKVPYAPIGTTLPIGFTLEPKKIRGILSDGMLCSETELGLGDGSSGLMELPEDANIGQTFEDYLNKTSDTVIDIDNKSLTHRPDLWGHYGFAREFAAIYGKKLKNPYDDSWAKNIEKNFSKDKAPVNVKVEKDCAGLAYWGLTIEGVTVETSPQWMQARLEACGLRPINSIVDISNYVMLELGMPNHIFDRSLISGDTVHIKKLGKSEVFQTLDEIDRDLIDSDTVICDKDKPLVIAGIMGGANSGVNEKTNTVFLEVANWKAAQVRSTSTRLGLRTDSSQRYEKTLDSTLCYRTLLRLVDLIKEHNPEAKVMGAPVYDGDNLDNIERLTIITSAQRITKVLGKEIDEKKIIEIFESLDFKVSASSGNLKVELPTYRTTKDIDCEADLIEEIGRIIGYDNIEETAPAGIVKPVRLSLGKIFQRNIQDFCSQNLQALEVMTYPMVGEKILAKANWGQLNKELQLINALSVENDRMRPSLIPTFLEAVALNQKNFENFKLFELGRSYLPSEKDFRVERNQVIIGYYHKKENQFVSLINGVQRLLNKLNLPYDLMSESGKFKNDLIPRDWSGAHPNEYLNIRIMGKFHGALTSVHPLLLRKFKIKGNLSLAIIDFEDFINRPLKEKTKYNPLAKFPSATFDCTVVANKDVFAADTLKLLKKVKLKQL
jgi:phenylalanyl-tRNA synthetase beta chain